MTALRFPQQVTHRQLRKEGEAERLFVDPRSLQIRFGQVTSSAKKIQATLLVTNAGTKALPLVVNPYGGSFPYGGDNPFALRFDPKSAKAIRYSGQLYPPEPPLPMLIEIPASSCVQFEAEINLQSYSYRGSPRVKVEWSFYIFKGSQPRGEQEIQLPPR